MNILYDCNASLMEVRRESIGSERKRCGTFSTHCTRRIPISYRRLVPNSLGGPSVPARATRLSSSQTSSVWRAIGAIVPRIRTFLSTSIYFSCHRRRGTCLHTLNASSMLLLSRRPDRQRVLSTDKLLERSHPLTAALISGFPKRLVHDSSTGNSQRTWNSSALSH